MQKEEENAGVSQPLSSSHTAASRPVLPPAGNDLQHHRHQQQISSGDETSKRKKNLLGRISDDAEGATSVNSTLSRSRSPTAVQAELKTGPSPVSLSVPLPSFFPQPAGGSEEP